VNVLADESVEAMIVERLRGDGNIVTAVAELSPGPKDPGVLAWAVRDHLLRLTADRDFGDRIMRDLSQAPREGVVLLRLKHTPPGDKALIVVDAFIHRDWRRKPPDFSRGMNAPLSS
jgi:hypothetical protein